LREPFAQGLRELEGSRRYGYRSVAMFVLDVAQPRAPGLRGSCGRRRQALVTRCATSIWRRARPGALPRRHAAQIALPAPTSRRISVVASGDAVSTAADFRRA